MGFCMDSVGLKLGPLIVDRGTAKIEHRLRAVDRPAHPRPFHPIFHDVAARSFDHPAGNRITGPEILVVTHPLAITVQVVADLRQLLSLFRGPASLGYPRFLRTVEKVRGAVNISPCPDETADRGRGCSTLIKLIVYMLGSGGV